MRPVVFSLIHKGPRTRSGGGWIRVETREWFSDCSSCRTCEGPFTDKASAVEARDTHRCGGAR